MPIASAISAARSGELEGRREPLGDERRDLSPLAQAEAELALHGVADEACELDREGALEAEIGAQLLALLRRRVLTQDVGDRIADVLEQHEGDERHRQHHEDGLDEAAKDEGKHGGGRVHRLFSIRAEVRDAAVPARSRARSEIGGAVARHAMRAKRAPRVKRDCPHPLPETGMKKAARRRP